MNYFINILLNIEIYVLKFMPRLYDVWKKTE